MKKLLLIPYAMIVLLIAGAGCTSQSKSEKLITEFMKKSTNDPASYEPISFGEPRKCRLSELPGGSPSDTAVIGVRIEHSYRAKNKFGALVKETNDFVVSSLNNDVMIFKTDGRFY